MSYRKLLLCKTGNSTLCRSTNLHKTFNRFYSGKTPKFTDGPIDPEVNFHSQLADKWWDMETCRPLHAMNEVRVPFITSGLNQLNPKITTTVDRSSILEGIDILDVGCGGGILSEALARLKANVTGLDPSHDLIKVARKHAEKDQKLQYCLRYEADTLHNFCQKNEHKFDAVVTSEVIEHIVNKKNFLQDCLKCVKPGGSIFVTTPNKTVLSKIFIVYLSEKLGIIPIGSHDFDKFIDPISLAKLFNTRE